MQQKTIWKLLLIIGMLSSISHSCSKGEIDRPEWNKFIIKNHSDYDLIVNQYRNQTMSSFEIKSQDSLEQVIDLFAGNSSDIIPFSDSAEIVFHQNKVLKFKRNSTMGHNILNLEEYDFISLSEELKEYHYLITEEDYNNAIPIEK